MCACLFVVKHFYSIRNKHPINPINLSPAARQRTDGREGGGECVKTWGCIELRGERLCRRADPHPAARHPLPEGNNCIFRMLRLLSHRPLTPPFPLLSGLRHQSGSGGRVPEHAYASWEHSGSGGSGLQHVCESELHTVRVRLPAHQQPVLLVQLPKKGQVVETALPLSTHPSAQHFVVRRGSGECTTAVLAVVAAVEGVAAVLVPSPLVREFSRQVGDVPQGVGCPLPHCLVERPHHAGPLAAD
mmetsp:Transcript_4401/g.9736  ORF Transcript_4401/g.9736 Transcript_4401/m.9736 type:complete len:245 (-) Transcript_4401:1174-1908(-)